MLASFREPVAVPLREGSALIDEVANGWVRACRLSDILRDTGVCALIYGKQIAVFRVGDADEVYALSNFDPFSKAMVLSRGIVGDRNGAPKVASPIYKQNFDLRSGQCLDDATVSVPVYRTRVQAGAIEILFSHCRKEPGMSANTTTPELPTDLGSAARVLALSTTAFTLLFAVWLMFGVLAIPIKQEFALTPVQFAWLTATAILSGSLLRLPFGILADRIGGRLVMTVLLLVTAIPCWLVSNATSYTELLLAALAFGIAGNSFAVGIAWNSAWYPRARQGVALGTFGAGNVGASVTKLIGPGLITLVPAAGLFGGVIPGGWRFIPQLYAVLLVAMAAALWLLAPAPDRRPGSGRTVKAMIAPLANLRVWRFGLYYVVVFGAYVALSLWLPNYYHEVYSLPLATAALLTTLFIFPASLLRPLGGWLSDRFGARPVTYGIFIGMLLVTIPLGLPASVVHLDVATFTILVVLLGVGMGIGKASVYRYIPDYFPSDVGAVGGLVGCLGALGGFVLPLAFGYLRQSTGSPESCFIAIGGLIAMSLLWLHTVVLGIKRRQRAAEPSAVYQTA